MYCPKCNTEVPDGSAYCLNCGASLALSGRSLIQRVWLERGRRTRWILIGAAAAVVALVTTVPLFATGVLSGGDGPSPGPLVTDTSPTPTSPPPATIEQTPERMPTETPQPRPGLTVAPNATPVTPFEVTPSEAVEDVRAINLRSEPFCCPRETIVGVLEWGETATVVALVRGQATLPGNDIWYQLDDGSFVYSGGVKEIQQGVTPASQARPVYHRESFSCTNEPPLGAIGEDYEWGTFTLLASSPIDHYTITYPAEPAVFYTGQLAKPVLRPDPSPRSEWDDVTVTVIDPNGTETTATAISGEFPTYPRLFYFAIYPSGFSGVSSLIPGTYTVVWEINEQFVACGGFLVRR